LKSPRISALSQITAMPADLWNSPFEWAFLEWPDRVFVADSQSGIPDLAGCSHGIAFSATTELRWQRRRSGYHAVLIDDSGGSLPGATLSSPLTVLDNRQPDQILLWGKRENDGIFREGRIPDDLSYPTSFPQVPTDGRVAVHIVHYELVWNEQKRSLFRCARVIPVPRR
jgi:hypothetical protein